MSSQSFWNNCKAVQQGFDPSRILFVHSNKDPYPRDAIVVLIDDSGSTDNLSGSSCRGSSRFCEPDSEPDTKPVLDRTPPILVAEAMAAWTAVAHLASNYDLEGVLFEMYAFSTTMRPIVSITLGSDYLSVLQDTVTKYTDLHAPELGGTNLYSSMDRLVKMVDGKDVDFILATDGHPGDESTGKTVADQIRNFSPNSRGIVIGAGSIASSHPGGGAVFAARGGVGMSPTLIQELSDLTGISVGQIAAGAAQSTGYAECDIKYLEGLVKSFRGQGVYAPAVARGNYEMLRNALVLLHSGKDLGVYAVQVDAGLTNLPKAVSDRLLSCDEAYVYTHPDFGSYVVTRDYQFSVKIYRRDMSKGSLPDGTVIPKRMLKYHTYNDIARSTYSSTDDLQVQVDGNDYLLIPQTAVSAGGVSSVYRVRPIVRI